MTYLFLDIDGVLNSESWFKRRKKLSPDCTREEFKQNDFDPLCCEQLRRIVKETNTTIVLSSTWRKFKEDFPLIKKFTGIDFEHTTGECCSGIRGAEIDKWLCDNVGGRLKTRYAILDDDSDMILWQKDSFFQTSWKNGLTKAIADKVIKHLNTPVDNPPYTQNNKGDRVGGDER